MKFYMATVTLRQVVQVEVSGLDEQAAREAAIAQVRLKHAGSGAVVDVMLGLRGESDFNPGTRVTHEEFGPGEVSELEGSYGEHCWVTVKFDSGEVKQLHSSHRSLRPEVL